jgi:putative ABC transport system substrate-binding protein
MPVIGYLSQSAPEAGAALVTAVRKGLGEVGIVEGRDVTSETRWARYDVDRLPGLAADLVQRRVAVIIALGTPPAARAAKAATSEIPIVSSSSRSVPIRCKSASSRASIIRAVTSPASAR